MVAKNQNKAEGSWILFQFERRGFDNNPVLKMHFLRRQKYSNYCSSGFYLNIEHIHMYNYALNFYAKYKTYFWFSL